MIAGRMWLLGMGLCVLAATRSQAQLVGPQLRTITTADGLSNDHICDLAMDQRGYLWVATSNGLNRFDGRSITIHRSEGHPRSLPGDLVTSLAVDSGHRLYVGTSAPYLTIMDLLADTLVNIPLPIPDFSRHGEQRVTDLLVDRRQRVWVAHGARCLSLFDPSTATFLTTEVAPPLPTAPARETIAMIDEDRDGTLWLSMFKGLVHFDPATRTATPMPLHPAPGEPDLAKAFQARGLVDEDSTLVFGTWSEGIFRMRKRDGQLRLLWPAPDHVPTFVDHMVTDMVRIPGDKALVACIDQGLLQLDLRTGRVDHFDRSLSEKDCREQQDLFLGCYRLLHQGDLVVMGSTQQGVALWSSRTKPAQAVPLPMHAASETIDEVLNVTRDPLSGDILALSFRRGLFIHGADGSLTRHITAPYRADQGFNSLQHLAGARWLIGGWSRGYELDLRKDSTLGRRPGAWFSCSERLVWARPDGRHGLWCMIAGNGVHVLDTIQGTCRPLSDVHPEVAGALSNAPWDVFLDSQGRNWFLSATTTPVVLLPDDRVVRVQGPTSMAPFEVSDIAETPDGRIWLAVKHTGLAMVPAHGSLVVEDASAALPSRNVLELAAMADGTLWMTVPGGLMHWDPELGKGDLVGHLDGIPSGPLNLDPSHAPLSYPVLVGTWEGFYRVHPSGSLPPRVPHVQVPLVLCMDTVVRRHADLEGQELVLPHTADRITIALRTTNLLDPVRDELAYRLVGHSSDWADIAGNERITFNSLPHGSFRFEVKARTNGGDWGAVTAFPITITPPFWATWWFRTFMFLLAVGCIWALFRLVLRNKLRAQRQRMQREQALLQERIRIAQDLHDDLGGRLAMLAMEGELAHMSGGEARAQEALKRVSEGAREVTDNMRRIVWALGSGQDSLGDLVAYVRASGAELMEHAGVELTTSVELEDPRRPLAVDQRRHLLLVTKELLLNVVKHAAATRAELSFTQRNGTLHLRLADNGRGFDPSAAGGTGIGLINLRSRVQALNGSLEVRSAPGNGCTVDLVIPLGVV